MRSPLEILSRRFGLGGPGEEIARLDVDGIGALKIAGCAAADPFIFGKLSRGEMFEPHILAALLRLWQADAVFADVGANIGVFTVCASRIVGPGGMLLAVEPEPENLRLLRRNLRLNHVAGAHVRGVAAGAAAGYVALARSADNAGDHRIGSATQCQDVLRVPMARLDSMMALPRAAPLVVKIDVQGSECAVLAGMSGWFDRDAPLRAVVEFWPFGLADCGGSAAALVDSLAAQFDRFWTLWSHCGPVPASPDDLRALAEQDIAPRTQMFTDIVALRAGDHVGAAAMMALQGLGAVPSPAGFFLNPVKSDPAALAVAVSPAPPAHAARTHARTTKDLS